MSTLRDRIHNDVKEAMKAQDKQKVSALRLITAAIKQLEVDQRIVLDDAAVLTLLNKASKQRRESIAQFQLAHRQDLIKQETYELDLIQTYLPSPLSDAELTHFIQQSIQASKASSMADMGRVMAHLKPFIQGRCDMSLVSARIKELLH